MKTYFDYFLFAQAEAWFPVMIVDKRAKAGEGSSAAMPHDAEGAVAGHDSALRGACALDNMAFSRVPGDLCHNAFMLDGSRAFSPFMENDRLARLALSGEITFFFNGQDPTVPEVMLEGESIPMPDPGVSLETLVDTFASGAEEIEPDMESLDRMGWNA